MPCTFKYQSVCRIYKVYIGSGGDKYKGELCGCCMWWKSLDKEVTETWGVLEVMEQHQKKTYYHG